MSKVIVLKKDGNFSLVSIPNDAGHSFYQLRFKDTVIWYFKAYKEYDGITSREIPAPYGLSEKDYDGAMQRLISFFKVA